MSWQDIPGRHAMGWIINKALDNTPEGGVWVEVGVALGKGLARMARTLIDADRHDVKLYGVDMWAGIGRNGEQQANGAPSSHGDWALFLDMMQKHAPEELRRVHLIRAPSTRAPLLFGYEDTVVDLCIVDAAHDFSSVLRDITGWMVTIRKGGLIGGDDHEPDFPGVQQACEMLFRNEYQWGRFEADWGTWARVMP